MNKILTIVPSRFGSSRLPGKPLIEIAGKPMILRVIDQAKSAGLGSVVVATDDERIQYVVKQAGEEAVMTRSDHESGSDRIFEALELVDPNGEHDMILNLQGDVPLINPDAVRSCIEPLNDSNVDISTIATVIRDKEMEQDPNFVKAIGTPLSESRLRALYFTRATAPSGDGPLYLHIGVYAYKRQALERFVSLPPSALEKRERLEQLRAIENEMRIDIKLIDSMPFDINTQQDVDALNRHLENQKVLCAGN